MKTVVDTKICRRWWQHACGLMLSRKRPCLLAFKKPRKVSLHSWFVPFTLDILVLERKKVVAKYSLPAWSLVRIPGKVTTILEVPSPSGIRKGDFVRVQK